MTATATTILQDDGAAELRAGSYHNNGNSLHCYHNLNPLKQIKT